tara:strand:- start:301 stop:1356 length:1056 start_codon:yes stop_codon:yes gene_type:complete
MSQNIYCNPKLEIENFGVIEDISGNISIPGNNQITSLTVTISGIHIPEYALMNKRIKFYLNHGGYDTVPYFMGLIKDVQPQDDKFTLTAYDVRCLLGGEYADKVIIDDFQNFDGLTLSGFLVKYINDNINEKQEYIDVSRINDTEPPIPMIGYRAEDTTPYSVCLELIQMATDESDIFNTFQYEIDVKYTSNASQIVFVKEKDLDEKPSLYMSYGDGIKSYSYKKLKIPNRARQDEIVVDYGSTNSIRITKDVTSHLVAQNFREGDASISRAGIQKELLKGLVKARKEKFSITLNATKGFYTGLGSIIYLNVDEEIAGPHRLVSKNISFDKNGVDLNLSLEAKPNTYYNYA